MHFTDAVRLAKQATFGPTEALISHMATMSPSSWLDEQFAAQGSQYDDLLEKKHSGGCKNTEVRQTICSCMFQKGTEMQMRFYAAALTKPDQLRQRVAFALSQIFVVSDIVHLMGGLILLNQGFLDLAFGNYRDILRLVTLNAAMGEFLNLADSSKDAPNENYARELMQLFTMGPNRLLPDGSLALDASGATIANYSATDVRETSRALTGWTWDKKPRYWILPGTVNNITPMKQNHAAYDDGEKNFLGVTVPAHASQNDSLDLVLDAVMEHPSTPPYIAKFFIGQLVTSNPSPAYVRRVARAFIDNGNGVRGDMRAMLRVILLDREARLPAANAGKVKEPVLLMTGIARLIGLDSDGWAFVARHRGMGQRPFEAPSVFNFYPPDYPLPLVKGMVSPPGKLIDTSTVAARHNLVYDWTLGSSDRCEFVPQSIIPGARGTQIDWTPWERIAANTEHLLDRVDLLMLGKTMQPNQRDALRRAVSAVRDSDPGIRARRRAQTALYVVGTSAQFQVDC